MASIVEAWSHEGHGHEREGGGCEQPVEHDQLGGTELYGWRDHERRQGVASVVGAWPHKGHGHEREVCVTMRWKWAVAKCSRSVATQGGVGMGGRWRVDCAREE